MCRERSCWHLASWQAFGISGVVSPSVLQALTPLFSGLVGGGQAAVAPLCVAACSLPAP